MWLRGVVTSTGSSRVWTSLKIGMRPWGGAPSSEHAKPKRSTLPRATPGLLPWTRLGVEIGTCRVKVVHFFGASPHVRGVQPVRRRGEGLHRVQCACRRVTGAPAPLFMPRSRLVLLLLAFPADRARARILLVCPRPRACRSSARGCGVSR